MTEVSWPKTSATEPAWPEFGRRVIRRAPTQGPEKATWRSDTYETQAAAIPKCYSHPRLSRWLLRTRTPT